MQKAFNEALHAYDTGEVPVGAILVNTKNEIVAAAHNQVKKMQNNHYHAEMIVLQQAQSIYGPFLDGMKMYITLEPCMMCMGALHLSRISLIIYALNCENFGACNMLLSGIHGPKSSYTHTSILCKSSNKIHEIESKKLLNNFFKSKR